MQRHLCISCIRSDDTVTRLILSPRQKLTNSRSRNPDDAFLLIYPSDARHLIEITHATCPISPRVIHPEMSEIHRTSIEIRHISHPISALFLPSANLYGSCKHRTYRMLYRRRSLKTEMTVFRTEHQRFIEPVLTCLHFNYYRISLSQSSHLASLANRISERRIG